MGRKRMKPVLLRNICHMVPVLVLALGLSACGGNTGSSTPGATEPPAPVAGSAAPEATETAASSKAPEIKEIRTLTPNEPLTVNGKELLYAVVCEEDTDSGEAYLTYGVESVDLGFAEYPCDSFVVLLGDDTFLVYATLGFSSDWQETVPVICKDGTLTALQGAEGGISSKEAILDAHSCILRTRASVFGTYGVTIPYTLTEKGLVQQDSYVTILNEAQVDDGSFLEDMGQDNPYTSAYDTDGRRILALKRDLTLHTENGEVSLPAGTIVYPIGFDPDTKQFYVEYDGGEGWFVYSDSSKGWGNSIEGKDEEDCFEFLAYAG